MKFNSTPTVVSFHLDTTNFPQRYSVDVDLLSLTRVDSQRMKIFLLFSPDFFYSFLPGLPQTNEDPKPTAGPLL